MNKTKMLTIAMAVSMIFCGVYFMFLIQVNDDLPLSEVISNCFFIIGGIVTLVFFSNNVRRAIASSLMGLALANLIHYVPQLFSDSMLDYGMAFVFVLAAIVLIYYSISIVFSPTASSLKAVILLAVIAAVDLIPIILAIHKGTFFVEIFTSYSDDVVRVIMYATIMVILMTKDMKLETFQKRLRRNAEYLFSAMGTDPLTYINRYGVRAIMSDDDVGWRHLDHGPIEMERVVPLENRIRVTELFLQRWKGDPRLHLTVRNRNSHSYVIAMSMVVEKIVLDADTIAEATRIRLYGQEGVFIEIMIRDPVEKKKGYIETIRWKKQKKRNAKYGSMVDHDRKEFY